MTSAALSYRGQGGRARSADPLLVDSAIRRGFPVSALLVLNKATGFTVDEIATLRDVSANILERAISQCTHLAA